MSGRSIVVLAIFFLSQLESGVQPALAGDGHFIFLVTGKPATGIPREEVVKMQAAHLGNFTELARQSKLSAAGPSMDAEKKIRGIVVVNAQSLPEVKDMFVNDPFVAKGLLELDAVPHRIQVGQLQAKLDSSGLEEVLLVVLHRGPNWVSATEHSRQIANDEHVAWLKQQYSAGSIGFASEFVDDARRLGVVIFRGKDKAKAEQSLAENPLVKQELATAKLLPQYFAKETLVPAK